MLLAWVRILMLLKSREYIANPAPTGGCKASLVSGRAGPKGTHRRVSSDLVGEELLQGPQGVHLLLLGHSARRADVEEMKQGSLHSSGRNDGR